LRSKLNNRLCWQQNFGGSDYCLSLAAGLIVALRASGEEESFDEAAEGPVGSAVESSGVSDADSGLRMSVVAEA
jgi:hypothetical protein